MTTASKIQSLIFSINESGDMLAFKRNSSMLMEKYGYTKWSEAQKDKKLMKEFKKLDEAPIEESKMSELDIARQATDTNPSDQAIEDESYQKGVYVHHGLTVDIENPKGSTRSGTAPDGTKWSSTMTADYGEIRDTEGADGDCVDIFLGDDLDSQEFYVIDQTHADGSFDEHKVVSGVSHPDEALELYLSNYEKGWDNYTTVNHFSLKQFIEWVNCRKGTSKPSIESNKSTNIVAKIEEKNMITANKLLDICESIEDIDESIKLTWHGDTGRSIKWAEAFGKVSRELDAFKFEIEVKVSGKKMWALVFKKGVLLGSTTAKGVGEVTHYAKGDFKKSDKTKIGAAAVMIDAGINTSRDLDVWIRKNRMNASPVAAIPAKTKAPAEKSKAERLLIMHKAIEISKGRTYSSVYEDKIYEDDFHFGVTNFMTGKTQDWFRINKKGLITSNYANVPDMTLEEFKKEYQGRK